MALEFFAYLTLSIIPSFLKLFPTLTSLISMQSTIPHPFSYSLAYPSILPIKKRYLVSSHIILLLLNVFECLKNLYFHLLTISKSPVLHTQPSVGLCHQYTPNLKINLSMFPYLFKNLLCLPSLFLLMVYSFYQLPTHEDLV